MDLNLSDKTAAVVEGASGIGRAINLVLPGMNWFLRTSREE